MQEITLEPVEIKLIDPRRTSLIEAPRREEKKITGREYRQMLRKAYFVAGVEFGIIVVMAVIIYILQAGPF